MPAKRRRHVPQRTCIACQQKRAKRELIRVVRTLEGSIEIDLQGKRSGRGAYLCPSINCWEDALEKGKLSRALKCQVTPDDMQKLTLFAASMQETATAPESKQDVVEL